jgi:hypothetical protein
LGNEAKCGHPLSQNHETPSKNGKNPGLEITGECLFEPLSGVPDDALAVLIQLGQFAWD